MISKYSSRMRCFLTVAVYLLHAVTEVAAKPKPLECTLKHWSPKTRVTILQTGHERALPLESFLGINPPFLPVNEISSLYYQHYAQQHGYEYAREVLPTHVKHGGDVGRPQAIQWHLKKSDLVVHVDFSVIVPLNSSILCLMEHWGFLPNSDAAVLQPSSVDQGSNTAFMVFRKSELSTLALRAWYTALLQAAKSETRPKGSRRDGVRPHLQQVVWNRAVRPHLIEGSELMLVPCNEAGGYRALQEAVPDFKDRDSESKGSGKSSSRTAGVGSSCAGSRVSIVARRHRDALGVYLMHQIAAILARQVMMPSQVEVLEKLPSVPLLQYNTAAFATNASLPFPRLLPPLETYSKPQA